jgi:hypothetical protein
MLTIDTAAAWADAPRFELLRLDSREPPEDTTPPILRAVFTDGRGRGASTDLGYLDTPPRVVLLELDEPGGVTTDAVSAVLTDERTNLVRPLDAQTESHRTDAVRIRLPLPAGIPPSIYAIEVAAADRLGNRASWRVRFNTLGFPQPFADLKIAASSGKSGRYMPSLDTRFYRSEKQGDFVSFSFAVPKTGTYRLALIYTRYQSYGKFRCEVDGKPAGPEIDAWSDKLEPAAGTADLGEHRLTGGNHVITLRTTGKNDKAANCFIGVCRLVLKPEPAGRAPHPAETGQ